jgi:GR25 family glycosyltransferase involved in LPS biosynthesis
MAGHSIPGLDKVVIISLDRRHAKRASMLGRASAAGIGDACAVFDAVDGSAIDREWLRAEGYTPYARWRIEGHPSRFFQRELKWGEIGCAISHLRVWEACAARALAGEQRPTLVLEDDVTFPPDFPRKLAGVLDAAARAPAECGVAEPDFIYLLSKPIGKLERGQASAEMRIDDERQLVLNPPACWKMGAYLLYPTGARKLAALPFRHNLVPVDDFLPAIAAGHPLRPDLDALFVGASGTDAPAGGGGGRTTQGSEAAIGPLAAAPAAAALGRSSAFVAYAVGPSLIAERRMSMSDTENSAEITASPETV